MLAEWSLPITEVCGSNPVISDFKEHLFSVNCIEKIEVKKMRHGMANKKYKQTSECNKTSVFVIIKSTLSLSFYHCILIIVLNGPLLVNAKTF